MATLIAALERPATRKTERRFVISVGVRITLLTLLAAAVLGYHPYAEDAGIYLAGVKFILHPANFPIDSAFITHHMLLSIFAPLMASLVRITHLPFDLCMLTTNLVLLWLLLYAALQLSRRLFPTAQMQWSAVVIFALSLSTPVAGTALYLADPYLTGRSFVAPLAIFAVCFALDRRWPAMIACIVGAALFHPLMTIYLGFVIVAVAIAQTPQRRWLFALPPGAVAAAFAVALSQHRIVETNAYVHAALTRTYFYLGEWKWYEDLGIALPIALLAILAWSMRRSFRAAAHTLSLASITVGVSVICVSLLFARPDATSHLIARMQVLREFYFIYIYMFLLAGAAVGRILLRNEPWRWVAIMLALSTGLFFVQRSLYPSSPHLEYRSATSKNPWQQAFLWIRANTPHDAVFAIDPRYISVAGEDAIGFRVAAERSLLADYSKDGGAAAIFPDLANAWEKQVAAAEQIDSLTDDVRLTQLAPYGVTWIILQRSAETSLDCPYKNSAVQVCKLF
jgi:hypothetical protein